MAALYGKCVFNLLKTAKLFKNDLLFSIPIKVWEFQSLDILANIWYVLWLIIFILTIPKGGSIRLYF